jgi:MFS family permease
MPARQPIPMPEPRQVERAMRLSYAQVMLGAVFFASTGGMFLIGFAIRLGADNILLGLMTTVPQFFVISQFIAAYMVEREFSRKRLTVLFSSVTPLCWFLIAAIPFFEPVLGVPARFAILIGVICLVTMSMQFASNARASWVGELVPAPRRGRFFGYCGMFGGIVGSVFAVAEGGFLDFVQSHGLMAFTALFFFGSLFGLASSILNLPQPDCPLPGAGARPAFRELVRGTFRNRPLMALAAMHAVLALGGIAGPFNPAYCLRDVGVSFFGLGLLNAVGTAAGLLSSPYWGRMVDRFGCRPILVLGLLMLAPCAAVWLAIPPGEPMRAYWLLPWTNFIGGVGGAGVFVAISTMMYKNASPEGRSVQFAAYNSLVTIVAAPMPLLGGWLVSTLADAGYAVDLRITFYLWSLFMLAAAGLAWRLKEPESVRTRALIFRHIPVRMAAMFGVNLSSVPVIGAFLPLHDSQAPAIPEGDEAERKD